MTDQREVEAARNEPVRPDRRLRSAAGSRSRQATNPGPRESIDELDREIIRHLQTDGRMSYSSLGQLIGLSDAATRQRVQRLTARGVIDIVAVTDPVKIGLGVQAMLGITVTGDARKIATDIGAEHDAVYVVMTAGRYDLIAEVVCRTNDDFVELVNQIRTSSGVATVETMTYLGITKQTYDWGVG